MAPFWFPDIDRYLAVTRAVAAPGLVEAAIRTQGSERGVWEVVADGVADFKNADGSLGMPSTAYCFRAARG